MTVSSTEMLSDSMYPILQLTKDMKYSLLFPDQFSITTLSHENGNVKLIFDDMADGYKFLSSWNKDIVKLVVAKMGSASNSREIVSAS